MIQCIPDGEGSHSNQKQLDPEEQSRCPLRIIGIEDQQQDSQYQSSETTEHLQARGRRGTMRHAGKVHDAPQDAERRHEEGETPEPGLRPEEHGQAKHHEQEPGDDDRATVLGLGKGESAHEQQDPDDQRHPADEDGQDARCDEWKHDREEAGDEKDDSLGEDETTVFTHDLAEIGDWCGIAAHSTGLPCLLGVMV